MTVSVQSGETPWYRDRAARSFLLLGFLPWLAGLNLVWESAQLPLYSLWKEARPGYIVFSVVHCTLGDLAIGSVALLFALVLTRSTALARWNWGRIAVLVTLMAAGYTLFSESVNVSSQNWQYSRLMPVVRAFGLEVGLSPLAQWLVIPSLALWIGRVRAPGSLRARWCLRLCRSLRRAFDHSRTQRRARGQRRRDS